MKSRLLSFEGYRTELVDLMEMQAGMIVLEDLCNSEGVLLIRGGTVLRESTVTALNSRLDISEGLFNVAVPDYTTYWDEFT